MTVNRPVYPFTAIVGQERLKRALLLNAINPRVGGVLIRGEKGTAKSTAVRALARLLPALRVVADCPYGDPPDDPQRMCDSCHARYATGEKLPVVERSTRLVELPVNASEDRVVGALDLEHALAEGQRRFEPGLLAEANRGVLYVDEVNLLDDHLVDLLLDAAAMGVNTVEREGISVSHPARFILVGTMNPEEGELRPQLLDRFGLVVEIGGLRDVEDRIAIIERRMGYDSEPEAFVEDWAAAEELLRRRIREAKALLPSVRMTPIDMGIVARLAIELGVDGHRADLAILEAARTHAALEGRVYLSPDDIRVAAELALPHRLRRQPFVEVRIDDAQLGAIIQRESERNDGVGSEKKKELAEERSGADAKALEAVSVAPREAAQGEAESKSGGDKQVDPAEIFKVKHFGAEANRVSRRAGGKRTRTRTQRKSGRQISSRATTEPITDLALDATLRAAAPYQRERRTRATRRRAVLLERPDLRQKIRVRRTRNAICFVVDASWSMAAEQRMQATKSAVLSLLRDAYQRRDRVGLVTFQREGARLLLPLTNSVELAERRLRAMPTGGKTPLTHGLLMGFDVLSRAKRRDRETVPLMVVLTDGQANVSLTGMRPQEEAYRMAAFIAEAEIKALVIDTEHPSFVRGLAQQLARHLRAPYHHISDLGEQALVEVVRETTR